MKEISTSEVKERLENGETLHLIDVRETEEVALGMIPGCVHIPLGEITERTSELNKANSYILICQAGGRSAMAGQYLEKEGFDVTNMVGGMADWTGKTE